MNVLQPSASALIPTSPPRVHGSKQPMRVMTYLLIGLVIAFVALVLAPAHWGTPDDGTGRALRLATFGGSLLALIFIMFAVGVGVTGQRIGVLWSARNTYSLSRLQIVLWTLLVLSALAAVVACRAHGLFVHGGESGLATALNIEIPTQLLVVMGISVASGAAAPAILSLKSQSSGPSQPALNAAEVRTGDNLQAVGRVIVRPVDAAPLIKDVFQGDEVSTAGTVDIGKLQQFIVTLLLVGVYFTMLLMMFWTGEAPKPVDPNAVIGSSGLPPLSDSFVYLLGISHAGYLAYKAAPVVGTPTGAPGATSVSAPLASQQLPRPQPPAIT
jgi:hypothetical protein